MNYRDFIPDYNKPVHRYKEFRHVQESQSLYKHQPFLATFFGNIYNHKDEILLFHEMGVGKTCTSVKIAERLVTMHPYEYRGVIVIARGQGLINNFVNEIADKCTDGKYASGINTGDDQKLFKFRQRKKIYQTYTFYTFEILAKMLKDLPDKALIQRFDSHIIIIDEAHNIRDNEHATGLKVYNEIHRLLHVLRHRKIVLLTGTPMKDGPEELAGLLNLILPLDRQMPVGNAFNQTFFERGHVKNVPLLKSYLTGLVSFLKSDNVDVPKVYMGRVVAPLTKFKLVTLPMAEEQNREYQKAWRLDSQNVNIYNNTRQTSLYVDDKGRCGKLAKTVATDQLAKYSCKYAFVIDRLDEAVGRGELSMVYSDLIQGSGLMMLSKLLEQHGWSTTPKTRRCFIVLTSCVSEAKKQHLLKMFNSPENCRGEWIAALLGSRVITEGFTLRNIIHEHILTPHWNYGETSQVIARGWRNSHHDLIALGIRPVVHVYQYAAISQSFPSIDLMMYKISEEKDFEINKIVQIIKESALDCYLFKNRNQCGRDGERDCQYTSCQFTCDVEPASGQDFDISTNYDLNFYQGSVEWKQHLNLLTQLFRRQWCCTWSQMEDETRDKLTRMQLVQLLHHVTSRYHVFINPRGNGSHLRYDASGVYLTTLYDQRRQSHYHDYMTSQYESKRLVTTASLAMRHYLRRNFVADIKRFQHSKDFLVNMPEFFQQILLKNVIQLRVAHPSRYLGVQRLVLTHYKSSLYEDDQYTGYHLKRGQSFCYDKCARQACDSRVVDDFFQAQKVKFETNPYGCYGQENRDLDEFCIKMTKARGATGDKRKIKSGRRCINWHKSELVRLIEDQLKLAVDPSASRIDMCKMIQKFFKKHHLIENDDTCGTQYKRKIDQ